MIKAADVHFVLSDTAILRSWCCYEVALFNKRQLTASVVDSGMRSLNSGMRSFVGRSVNLNYQTFAQTQSSKPEDKLLIERSIAELFPDGMSSFNALMLQASLLFDPFVVTGFAQSTHANDTVRQSIDRWLTL